MYAIIPQQIPRDKRAEVNEKILFAIDSGKDLIPKESIYNCYTGIGGLHNLKQADFSSYHRYAEAKKEFEMGQFFTPHELCRSMVEVLSPTSSEMVLDMCCGMGNFFNHLPNLHNSYGFDIDGRAVTVARHLYPEAHIEKCDIQQYRPEQRFDVIIGNPPFNLKFDCKLSQEYYMDKAYDVLNPAGFLMVIVPVSFMQSEFWEKTRVANINSSFSFVGQTKLNPDAFDSMGVHNFSTKVMVFLRRSRHIEMQPYNADEFIPMEELKDRVRKTRVMKQRIRIDLMRETNRIDREELEAFEYRLSKYMYELKAHAVLNRHIEKAEALVSKFRNQKPPENATNQQIKDWERKKLTTGKVLGIIRKYITSQHSCTRIARARFGVGQENERTFDVVRRFYVLVDQHFREKKQVQDYADMLCRSPKTLSNLFSACGLPSPLRIIHERIGAEARRLLLYTRKSAKEISAILGFEDLAAFSRFFKKMTGESVSEYRKQAHREELPTVTE